MRIAALFKKEAFMLYSIPKTRMLSSAQNSLSPDSKTKSMFSELLVFLLVAFICSFAMGMIESIALSVVMMLDPSYHTLYGEMMQSGAVDTDALMSYMDTFLLNLPSEIYIVFLASSGLYILASLIYCVKLEKRRAFSMGFNKKGILPEYFLGLGVGAVMIAIPALICFITGCVKFSFNSSASPLTLVLFFLAFVLQGMGEEVLFRGYLMTSLCRRHNEWVAIIVSALMFAVFHVPNASFSIIAFVNILLFGIFAGVFMLKRGSIWAVGAIHTAWNYLQGNIFGISVSGNPKFTSLLNASNSDFGAILSGGDFGLEGGLGATVLLLVALLLALMMPPKKSELDPDYISYGAKE